MSIPVFRTKQARKAAVNLFLRDVRSDEESSTG
jgi:hypothetical protein